MMNRRDALKSAGALVGAATIGRLMPGCVDAIDEGFASSEIAQGYPPNFALLHRDTTWRTTWPPRSATAAALLAN